MLFTDRPTLEPVPDGWVRPLKLFNSHLVTQGRRFRTIETRIRHIRTLARGLDAASPDHVQAADLESWCGQQDWQPETRHAYYSSFRRFFSWWSARTGSADPSTVLPSIRRPVPPPRPAPDEAIAQAINAAPPRTRLILVLAAQLGLRSAEIAHIHTRDLGELKDGWSELAVYGKGGTQRVLPVPRELYREIIDQAEPGGWVFPGRIDGHLSPAYVGLLARRVLPQPWTLHTLRHRFATTAYNDKDSGKDLLAIKAAMGHQSITTTQRYTKSAMNLRALINSTTLRKKHE